MEWNLKTSPWDLTEFVPETNPDTNLVSGSSSFGSQGIKGDFSVDLKLGQVVDLGNDSSAISRAPSLPKMAVSPSGSTKRARAVNNGVQTASCLVDGCKADLSSCREYHRRHKVCELHSKTPQVTIGGHKQRFCQQCSRFHSLEEFDDEKRSCRKRLDGHNRRRRKPQPEPTSHTESFLPNYQDSRLFPFTSPHTYPTNAVPNPVWAGVVKSEQHKLYNHHHQQQQQHLPLLDKQSPFAGSSNSYGGEKQFSFLQGTTLALGNQTVPEASVCQPFLKPVASSESGGGGSSREIFCGDLSTQTLNSDCALSLLSSPQSQTPGIGLSHMLPPDSIPLAQPLGLSMQYNSLEPLGSSLVSNAANVGATDVHCSGIFQMGHEAPSSNESPQTLPFYWE